tara:strand:+ start:29490 stop:29930 length:441 start_codon:yes stop_codon:yes gene_type:complete
MGILSHARAKTTLMLMSKGQGSKDVLIPKIPSNWDFFLGTKDRWIEIDFPKELNSTNAIYDAKEGSIFPPHYHRFSDEMITVLNKKGKVRIITELEITTIYYGETYVFPYGIKHAVVFEEDTQIFIHWHPHFEDGWEADFLGESEI